MTELLSVNGYFRSYLHEIGKEESPDCMYCLVRCLILKIIQYMPTTGGMLTDPGKDQLVEYK